MQVKTQPFKEAIELKSEGISFDVYGNGAKRLGDLCVTKAGLVWSKGANGKAQRAKGINVKWEDFISWVQSQQASTKNGLAAKTSMREGGLPKLASAKTPAVKAKSRALTGAKKPALTAAKPSAAKAKKAN
jgi:hypothetical protein